MSLSIRSVAVGLPAALRARRVRLSADVMAVAVVAVVAAAFAGYRFWQAFTGEPIVWADTVDYERSAVWAGPRPPLVPWLLGATGSYPAFVALQAVVGVLAWLTLAGVVASTVRTIWGRVVAVTLVLAFGCTTGVVRWDRSVLSESLAMSTLALLLAALLWYAQGRATWPRVLALVGAALVFAAARDPHVWVVWGLAVVVGVDAVVRGRGMRAVAAALAMGLGAGVLLGGSLAADRTDVNVEHVYAVRVFPHPDRLAWFADHGMPNGDQVRAYAAAIPPTSDTAPVLYLDRADPAVASLFTWLDEHGAATLVRWLLTHPVDLVAEPLRTPERSYNDAHGDLSFYSAPGRTELVALDTVLSPPGAVVAVLGALAVAVGVVAGGRRRAWWWMLVAFGGLGVAHVLIAWHGDGMESTRHVAVGDTQLRLAVLLLTIAAVSAVAARAMDRRAREAVELGA